MVSKIPLINRHEQRKASTRQNLLNAARELIAEEGYQHVEILDITERANVSKATFYQHFSNKETCVRELMLQGFDALVDEIFSSGLQAPSRPEWARNSHRKIFRWAEANRNLLLIMVGGEASAELNQFGRQYTAEITTRFLQEFGAAERGNYPLDVKAQFIAGVLIQLLGWWLEKDTGYSAEQVADMMYEILKHGLGPLDG